MELVLFFFQNGMAAGAADLHARGNGDVQRRVPAAAETAARSSETERHVEKRLAFAQQSAAAAALERAARAVAPGPLRAQRRHRGAKVDHGPAHRRLPRL